MSDSDDAEEISGHDSTDELSGSGDESTVPFKCIGVTRDVAYQALLKELKDVMDRGDNLDIMLVPEPHNPYDSKAIAFQCYHNGSWKTMGYIVREALSEMHDA